MTLYDFLSQPGVAAGLNALLVIVTMVFRFMTFRTRTRAVVRVYELQASATTEEQRQSYNPASLPDIPLELKILGLIAFSSALAGGFQAARHHRPAEARAAGEPQPPTQPRPTAKSCYPSCPTGQRCNSTSGLCETVAEERKSPRRAGSDRKPGPMSASGLAGWGPCCPPMFDHDEPAL